MAAAVLVIGACCVLSFSSSLSMGVAYPDALFGPQDDTEKKPRLDLSKLRRKSDNFIRGTTIRVNRERQNQKQPIKIKEIKVYDENGLEFKADYEVTQSADNEFSYYQIKFPTFKEVNKFKIIPETGCEASLVGSMVEFMDSVGSVKWYDQIITEKSEYEYNIFDYPLYTQGRAYYGTCGLANGLQLLNTESDKCLSNCNAISRAISAYKACRDDDDTGACSPELEDVQKYSSDVTSFTLDTMDTSHKEYCDFDTSGSCTFFKTARTLTLSDAFNCSSNSYCYDLTST